MIRKCLIKDKMVKLESDCKDCQLKDQCKNPDGPDGNKNRQRFQVIVK